MTERRRDEDKGTRGQGDKGTRGQGDMGIRYFSPRLLVSLSPRLLVFISLFLLASAVGLAQPPRKKNAPQPGAEPPPVSPEEATSLEAVITTDLGVIRFEFFPDKAPKHVQAFVKNARAGFYDGSEIGRAHV